MRGSGSPLILLHGFTGSGESWPDQALAPLLDSFSVACVDLPGHGASHFSDDSAEWTIARTIERLVAVQEACFGGPSTWLGYSMGGRLALRAATVGVPMRTLLLESASPGLSTPAERAVRRDQDGQLADRIVRDGIEAFVDHWTRQPLFASHESLPELARETLRSRRIANDPDQLALALRGLGTGTQPSVHDKLESLQMPVELITGSLDEKFSQIARTMTGQIPTVSHRVVEGVGHTVHVEAPAEWAAWVATHADRSCLN